MYYELTPGTTAVVMLHIAGVLQYFSTFDHITSEYERKDLLDRFAKLSSKLAEVGDVKH